MIILGIDPALKNTGYGLLRKEGNSIIYVSSGIIQTKNTPLPQALFYISNRIDEIINEFNPDSVSLERVFINNNPLSSMSLCYARGSILATIGKYKLPIEEFAPTLIKKSIAGSGKATKEQMISMVNILLPGHNFTNHDEVDAISCAYTATIGNKNLVS